MKNFYKILFFSVMTTSTLLAISSISWMVIWASLEMNLLTFIPLMKMSKNKFSSESSIKYFITQALASYFLLFMILISALSTYSQFELYISILLDSTLLMKMGVAPFHFWLPEVSSGISWEMNMILLMWQKIAPMILISYSPKPLMFLSTISIFSSMFSSILGFNQTCLRKIMAYSSINHSSWMVSALLVSLNTWLMYFFTYCMININIMIFFNKYNIFFISQMSKLNPFNKTIKMIFMMNFLSLGGLPPFLGFFPKWLVTMLLIKMNLFALSLILILSSLLSLYFYLRIATTMLTICSEESLLMKKKMSFKLMFFNTTVLSLLILCSLLTSTF
uniref:NADH-ubiquinone oxidoreductase chain 2 n=1 Tax=Curculionoidea sp. 13 KM-2017 TaxID=2219396 RepID=A0A346RHE4_9CUCU|nr:NADH dehydrogenase subunit 2 [Curculionoidea sp. 13 KM-2017]